MEGREEPHIEKQKEIRNNWNYGAICTMTSLSVCDSKF
jgi:hypothetical protein